MFWFSVQPVTRSAWQREVAVKDDGLEVFTGVMIAEFPTVNLTFSST